MNIRYGLVLAVSATLFAGGASMAAATTASAAGNAATASGGASSGGSSSGGSSSGGTATARSVNLRALAAGRQLPAHGSPLGALGRDGRPAGSTLPVRAARGRKPAPTAPAFRRGGPNTGQATRPAHAAAAHSLAAAHSVAATRSGAPTRSGAATRSGATRPAQVAHRAIPRTPPTTVNANFQGVTQPGANCGNCQPPDPNAAVGRYQIAEAVNLRLEVYNKGGGAQCGIGLSMAGCGRARPGGGTTGGPAAGQPAGASGEPAASGIQGMVTVDEGCPQITSTPCPRRPMPARLVIRADRAGQDTVYAATGPDGRFRVPLRPGHYTIQPLNLDGAAVPTAMPVTVRVRQGTWAALPIEFDSGVR